MLKTLYKILSVIGDVKAASKGPTAYGKRAIRKKAHKGLAKSMRKWGL